MLSMINTFRSVRIHSPCLISQPALPSNLGHKASLIRLTTASASKEPDTRTMDKGKEENPNDKNGDLMSHSFGEGYATRSDEEGFGGIYGGNQSTPKDEKDQSCIHENHPEYDKTQGSEVKEKEKARFQTSAHN